MTNPDVEITVTPPPQVTIEVDVNGPPGPRGFPGPAGPTGPQGPQGLDGRPTGIWLSDTPPPGGVPPFIDSWLWVSEIEQSDNPYEPLKPQHFGAAGDGITDDTAAIQQALAVQLTTGQEVFFPAGKYKITEALDLFEGGRILRGTGESSEIVQHGVDVPVIRLGGAGNRITDLGLNRAVRATSTGDAYRRGESGIEIESLYLSTLERIRIANVSYGLVLPNDKARFCFSNSFRDFDILEVYGGAISIVHHPSSGSTGNVWQNIYCNGSYLVTHDWPVKIQGVHDSVWEQLNIEGFTGGGMLLLQQSGGIFRSLHIEFDTLTDYYPSLIRLYDAANMTVDSMTIQNTDFSGDGASGISRVVSIGTDNCSFIARGVRGLGNVSSNALPIHWAQVEDSASKTVEVRIDGLTWYGSGARPQVTPGERGVWSIGSRPTVHHARLFQAFVEQPLVRWETTPVLLQRVHNGNSGWFVQTDVPNVLRVEEAGTYLLEAGVKLRGLESGETNLLIMVNGNVAGQNGGLFVQNYRPSICMARRLNAGDQVSLAVYTESTGTPAVFESDSEDTWLSVTYMGP